MNTIMSKFLKSSLLSSIGLAVLGGMLIFQSECAIISISYVIGAILVAIGTLALIEFLKKINDSSKNELDIVYGIVTIIMGIIVIGSPQTIASIIPFVIGMIIIISSAAKLQYSIELKKSNNNLWKSTMVISLITLLCGIILVFNPFQGAEMFMKTIGVLIFLYAVLDIISTLSIQRTVKSIHSAIEEKITEADVIVEEESDTKSSLAKRIKKKETKTRKKRNKKEDREE